MDKLGMKVFYHSLITDVGSAEKTENCCAGSRSLKLRYMMRSGSGVTAGWS